MNFNRSAVQRTHFDFEGDDLRGLHGFEDPGQHAPLCPPAHPRVNGMPVPVIFGQTSPFSSVLSNIEDGIEDFQVAVRQAATVLWEKMRDPLIVLLGEMHSSH